MKKVIIIFAVLFSIVEGLSEAFGQVLISTRCYDSLGYCINKHSFEDPKFNWMINGEIWTDTIPRTIQELDIDSIPDKVWDKRFVLCNWLKALNKMKEEDFKTAASAYGEAIETLQKAKSKNLPDETYGFSGTEIETLLQSFIFERQLCLWQVELRR